MLAADAAARRLTECLGRGGGLRPSIDRACASDVCAALLFRLVHSTAVLATPIIVFFLLEWYVHDAQPNSNPNPNPNPNPSPNPNPNPNQVRSAAALTARAARAG